MTKEKMKLILKYSFILGLILGGVSIIPYINILTAITMCIFSSILVIYYMEKKDEIGSLTIKGSAILGIVIGFVSLIGYLIVNLPINAILGAIFSGSRYYSLSKFLIEAWWLLVIMTGILTSIFNSFALISYTYIRDTYFMIEGKKEIKGNFTQRNNNGF